MTVSMMNETKKTLGHLNIYDVGVVMVVDYDTKSLGLSYMDIFTKMHSHTHDFSTPP